MQFLRLPLRNIHIANVFYTGVIYHRAIWELASELYPYWFVTGRGLKGLLHCWYEMLPATWGAHFPLGYCFVYPYLMLPRKAKKASCFSHSATLAFKDNGLSYSVLSPLLL